MITFEEFNEKFLELYMSERIDIYNRYCDEFDSDARIEDNESYNMSVYFEDVIDALRAAQYGEYSVIIGSPQPNRSCCSEVLISDLQKQSYHLFQNCDMIAFDDSFFESLFKLPNRRI